MRAQSNLVIYLLAGLGSAALTIWAVTHSGIINHDAVFYLQAIEGDAASIRQIGNWLFYSRLIHWLSLPTGLAPEQAAYLLNLLLDTLLVLAFIRLIEELGGRRLTLIWAAAVVLSLPYLNDNRAEIVRDHGYWALSLVAMIFYLRLWRRFSWRSVLGWNLALLGAALFRVEGVVFLALMPMGLLLHPEFALRQRLASAFCTLLPALLALIALGLMAVLDASMQNRLLDTLANSHQLVEIFTRTVPQKALQLQRSLPDYSLASLSLLLYAAVLWAIAGDLLDALSWPWALVLVLRRWFPAPDLPRDYRLILRFYAAITLLVLFVHGAHHFIMVSRYTMALALMLLPAVVFALDDLIRRQREQRRRPWLPAGAVLAVALLLTDSLINSAGSKAYITEAARWAGERLPPGSRVVTDYEVERLAYYTRKAGGESLRFQRFQPGKAELKGFNYAFVRRAESRLGQRLARQKSLQVIKIEPAGEKGVMIYRLSPNNAPPHSGSYRAE